MPNAPRPMAPARTARLGRDHSAPPRIAALDSANGVVNEDLFLEPMMGTPLQVYIEKDVNDRDILVELVTKHGGAISPGYSGVPYILVDPHKESGQNLFRQYVGKKGKVVLNARWIHECIRAGALQTFSSNWAGCKVDGTEVVGAIEVPSTSVVTLPSSDHQQRRQSRPSVSLVQVSQAHQPQPPQAIHPHPTPMQPGIPSVDPYGGFAYTVYGGQMHPAARPMQPPTAAPPQTWHAPNTIAPQQTHMVPRPAQAMREEPTWNSTYEQAVTPASTIVGGPAAPGFDYRYREDNADWVGGGGDYYGQPYEPSFENPGSFLEDPNSSNADASTLPADPADKTRGRKRSRLPATPAPPPSSLVVSRRAPARSPTPPTRIIKSTYGGNLFTSDDVEYLKKYIDYCQDQGLVLSLREICERIAVKAPHHTFYSWRRYCNKHQIRLGGYVMNAELSPAPQGLEQEGDEEEDLLGAGPGPSTLAATRPANQIVQNNRSGSPTPPKALFRSTTGKGVAFTEDDVAFLMRFMEYRKSQGKFDMVAFWKDVAAKAPHHSRASWMKFWRRHKHELSRTDNDEPLPLPPDKKMRYSYDDDVLLANYFLTKPEGTSDKIFQAFGRIHPHHPWKGWQEHHRIHKAKIDHLMQRLSEKRGDDSAEPPGPE